MTPPERQRVNALLRQPGGFEGSGLSRWKLKLAIFPPRITKTNQKWLSTGTPLATPRAF